MNRVAAEASEKVSMLFQNENFDTRTRQEEPKHHASRSTANYTTARFDLIHGKLLIILSFAPLRRAASILLPTSLWLF
jgi:hypothetical protein